MISPPSPVSQAKVPNASVEAEVEEKVTGKPRQTESTSVTSDAIVWVIFTVAVELSTHPVV